MYFLHGLGVLYPKYSSSTYKLSHKVSEPSLEAKSEETHFVSFLLENKY